MKEGDSIAELITDFLTTKLNNTKQTLNKNQKERNQTMSTTQENSQAESIEPIMAKMLSQEQLSELPGKEMTEKRTINSKTYDLGGGHYQAVIYPEPVHYRNAAGEWEEMNHSLNETANKLLVLFEEKE